MHIKFMIQKYKVLSKYKCKLSQAYRIRNQIERIIDDLINSLLREL